MRYDIWLDGDENIPKDNELLKAYDRYISYLVSKYDLTRVPSSKLTKKLKNLANCIFNHSAERLKTFPYRRWEREHYKEHSYYHEHSPVEFKKKWLKSRATKKVSFVHSLSEILWLLLEEEEE